MAGSHSSSNSAARCTPRRTAASPIWSSIVGVQAGFRVSVDFHLCRRRYCRCTWRGLRRQEANWLLLAAASAPILLYFLIHSYSSKVLTQWPSAAYPAASSPRRGLRGAGGQSRAPAAGALQLSSRAVAADFVSAWSLCVQMAARAVCRFRRRKIHNNRFSGWAGLSSDTHAIAKRSRRATSQRATTAPMPRCFLSARHGGVPMSEMVRYTFLPPVDQVLLAANGGNLCRGSRLRRPARLRQHFDSVELVSTIWRDRNGEPIEPYRIYRCKGIAVACLCSASLPHSSRPVRV